MMNITPPMVCVLMKNYLADGLVMDNVIECPKHNGRFDYTGWQRIGSSRLRKPTDLSCEG